MDRGHPPGGLVERALGDPRPGGPLGVRVQATPGRERDQGGLQRITNRAPLWILRAGRGEGGVVAQQPRAGQGEQRGRPAAGDVAGRVVAGAGDHVDRTVRGDGLPYRHPAFGERAGLVRGDHGDRTERLHGGQPPGHRVGAGHPVRAQRQREGDHRRQRLRHRGHDQAHRGDGHVQHRAATGHPGGEHHCGQYDRGEAQDPAEPGQPALQRCGPGPGGGHERGDPAERAGRAGAADNAGGPAGEHDGAGVRFVADRAGHRQRFAGERGLVQLQVVGDGQAQVGGDDVAGLQVYQVVADHLRGWDHHVGAVADHPGGGGGEPVQGGDGAVGAYLLGHADRRVHDDDQGDDGGVGVVAERAGDHGGGE